MGNLERSPMRRLLLVLFTLALAGCADFPSLSDRVSEASLNAEYPKLIALSQEVPEESTNTGAEVIEELDSRTAGLWARIGTLFN